MNDRTGQHNPNQPLPQTVDLAEAILGGDNLHGEVAGCPTGLSDPTEVKDEQEALEKGHAFKPEVEELKGSRITGRAR